MDIKYTSSNHPINTYEQLYDVVLKNNDDFMKRAVNENFYNEFRNGKLKEICKLVMDVVNKYINEENKYEVY